MSELVSLSDASLKEIKDALLLEEIRETEVNVTDLETVGGIVPTSQRKPVVSFGENQT